MMLIMLYKASVQFGLEIQSKFAANCRQCLARRRNGANHESLLFSPKQNKLLIDLTRMHKSNRRAIEKPP